MADPVDPPEPTDPPDPQADPPDPDDKPDPSDDEVAKLRAQLKKANKEAADSRGKLKQFEDAGKTEHEKLTENLTKATTELSTAQAASVRFEVALDKGLTKAQAKRLVGTTREEIEADADLLLEELGGDKPKPADRPRERLRGGGDPTVEPDETDPRKLAGLVDRR